MKIRILALALLVTLAMTACGRGDGPTDDDVINAIVAYYGNAMIMGSSGSPEEAKAKIQEKTTVKSCSADESHSTSTARAYQCRIEYKGGKHEAIAHLLLESGRWRLTSMDG